MPGIYITCWYTSIRHVTYAIPTKELLIMLSSGAAFVELYFVLSSLFASRAYYAFGFLALTAGVFALTTATVSILFTYFLLCAEEYRWHWRAFFAGGGSAFWLLAYGLFYWASRLSLDSTTSFLLYLGYLILLALLDFLVTGETRANFFFCAPRSS
jgi:transmembrane 9 superfamily member 2/4